ncbi:hypothetical protein MHYP_G00338080 [Metynnis hypsauchen]
MMVVVMKKMMVVVMDGVPALEEGVAAPLEMGMCHSLRARLLGPRASAISYTSGRINQPRAGRRARTAGQLRPAAPRAEEGGGGELGSKRRTSGAGTSTRTSSGEEGV